MKRIVLSEGKRDVKLLKRYYEAYTTDVELTTFIAEEVQYSRLKNQESETIRNFLEPRNPYHVLAKSENGKPDLKTIFVKLIRFLVKRDASICMLIDLDSCEISDIQDELDTRVRDNFQGRTLSVRPRTTIARSSAMVATRNELFGDGDVLGAFDILAFNQDLEQAADISDDESEQTERDKLDQFLSDRERSSPIHEILN